MAVFCSIKCQRWDLTIDSNVFPYRKMHLNFSYRSFAVTVLCFHQIRVILRQEPVIDHMAPFIPETREFDTSFFLILE